MLRLLVLALAAVCGLAALVGCGGAASGRGNRSGYISTVEALTAVKQAGFKGAVVEPRIDRKVLNLLNLIPAGYKQPDADSIDIPQPADSPTSTLTFLDPLVTVRLPTAQVASKVYSAEFALSAVQLEIAELRKHDAWALPRHLNLAWLTTTRQCNVVMTSYAVGGNPTLLHRARRAVALLHAKCRAKS